MSTLRNVLYSLVNDKVNRNQMFRAADLVADLKAKGIDVPLAMLKAELVDMDEDNIFWDEDYKSVDVIVNGDDDKLYMPEDGNPNSYLAMTPGAKLDESFSAPGEYGFESAPVEEEESGDAEGPHFRDDRGCLYRVEAMVKVTEPVRVAGSGLATVFRSSTW